jgi:hypothetical protein
MDNVKSGIKASSFIGLLLIIVCGVSGAFAWGGGWRHSGYYRGFHHGYAWGFYRPYWGVNFSYITPSVGAIVAYMPAEYTTVVVNGIKYYYCDGYYFRSCPSGYVVVPAPTVSSAPPAASAEQAKTDASGASEQPAAQETPSSDGGVTINIPNAGGGFTSVKLVKVKDGYKGPQGEFYPGHPTVDELRALYGK